MGATVHLHYCMGKLFGWSLTDQDSKNCGQCGMPKSSMSGHCLSFKDGCCQDKHAHLQLDKDQKTTEGAYNILAFSPATLPMGTATIPDNCSASFITGYPTVNGPPGPEKCPLFIRNCTFLI
jgi:hypothetical protein